jgi:hypothetical protein
MKNTRTGCFLELDQHDNLEMNPGGSPHNQATARLNIGVPYDKYSDYHIVGTSLFYYSA